MPTETDKDLGNFIDALLESLEQLAGLETVYNHNEEMKRLPAEKQKIMYIAIEDAICDFEQKTGVSAGTLLKKWNKSNERK